MENGDAGRLDLRNPTGLDRPFLYMIVDTHTNLPIFLGTVTDLC